VALDHAQALHGCVVEDAHRRAEALRQRAGQLEAGPVTSAEIGSGEDLAAFDDAGKADGDALNRGQLDGQAGDGLQNGLRRCFLGRGRAQLGGNEVAGAIQHRRLDVGAAYVDRQREGSAGSCGRLVPEGFGGDAGHRVRPLGLRRARTAGSVPSELCAGVSLVTTVVSRRRVVGKSHVPNTLSLRA
jgi:hypothetical protein